MITQEEASQFCKMMNWAKEQKSIKTMSVKIGDIVIVRTDHNNKQVTEGHGKTLTEAMASWTKLSSRVTELSRAFNE